MKTWQRLHWSGTLRERRKGHRTQNGRTRAVELKEKTQKDRSKPDKMEGNGEGVRGKEKEKTCSNQYLPLLNGPETSDRGFNRPSAET